MGKTRKRHYTHEFKLQAVELGERLGLSRAAEQLGVHVTNLQRWKTKAGKMASTGKISVPEAPRNLEEENRRLQKKVDELEKVNYILKRAAAVFSQDQLK